MSDLWQSRRDQRQRAVEPLAVRMRPRSLDEFVGQEHILGEGKLLRRMLKADAIVSIILHGPPGTGKTTLAQLIAQHSQRRFISENAAQVGVKRIREIIEEAEQHLHNANRRTILFLDEIHRFTKAQQDVLLSDVERGLITLIGATTENPLFAVNSALVSRSTLFRLEPISPESITALLRRALGDPERGYGQQSITADDDALAVWAAKCDGDARRALTALEVAVLSSQAEARDGGTKFQRDEVKGSETTPSTPPSELTPTPSLRLSGTSSLLHLTRQTAEDSIQQKACVYDDDQHYDSASALIKSVRGSDPDAACYWLARMLEGGEDPRFIARRLAILASEDVGNADPRAIMVAAACYELVERIGMPEARLTLAQTAIYLALAPKSNASYLAISAATTDVREGRTLPVPVYLRDPNSSPVGEGVRTKNASAEKYHYSHEAQDGVTGQDYLGVEKTYYTPTDRGLEAQLKVRLEELKKLREPR